MQANRRRSEEHTSELQSHSEISYAVFCLTKKKRPVRTAGWTEAEEGRMASWASWACFDLVRYMRGLSGSFLSPFFFFNDTATTEIYTLSYTLSLHDALPI